MEQSTILVVEDEMDILQLVDHNLKLADFHVLTAQDGYEALSLAKKHLPQLVILDLMLPGLDGFEVCKELKRSPTTKNIPVLMLTARGEEVDRIVGLELGADDYVVKPFSPRELVLRVRAILRRFSPEESPVTRWQRNGLGVDYESHRVTVDNQETILTATEFRLLAELIRNLGKVLTRDQLLDKVWGYQFDGYARTVDTHIRRLRQKIGPYAEWIETVRGVGYRFRD
ncbi:MAG: response regulator transcription factor [Syntrophobacterales bacterium]|jgi:two-component system phosphate regulon response regulator PhoB